MDVLYNLNPVLLAFIATIFTYIITASGAALVFVFKNVNKKVLDVMLGLASASLDGASKIKQFFVITLPLIWNNIRTTLTFFVISTINLSFLMVQIMTGGGPNGQTEVFLSYMYKQAYTSSAYGYGMAIGVAFGALAFSTDQSGLLAASLLALGIGIQNFPEGVCVAMPLRKNGETRMKSFFVGQASGIVEPIAGVIGALFAITVRNILPYLLTFSAGAMIAVVCSELIPDAFKDNKVLASLGVIFGFIIMMVLDIAFG
ncbi:MAG: hypothetical protein BHW12_02490 [Coprobacillus sp. 28_7]|nr:MAG: hypothetical protein BHW12_02490 [Coprobacillus sp. 28_7]